MELKAEIIPVETVRLFNIQPYEMDFYISDLNAVCIINLN
jgi:hypothetical protein